MAWRRGTPSWASAGHTMSPGLAKMTARAAAAVPFAKAAGLVGELAGITLTVKRAGRHAEADGAAAAAVIAAQAAAITARHAGAPLPPAAAAGQALHRDRRHRRADDDGRDRGPATAKARTARPAPARSNCACVFTQTSIDDDG